MHKYHIDVYCLLSYQWDSIKENLILSTDDTSFLLFYIVWCENRVNVFLDSNSIRTTVTNGTQSWLSGPVLVTIYQFISLHDLSRYNVHAILHSNHLTLVPYIRIHESGKHWFKERLVAYSAPKRRWVNVNWNLRNKLQWSFDQNTKCFIQENAYEHVIYEMAVMLSRGRWVKT